MKKYLVIYYSQTGQTQHAASLLEENLSSTGTVDTLQLIPEERFPFPWGFRDFFAVFQRCILGQPCKLKPFALSGQDYDTVFLLAQVWFLSPSLPIQGFLKSPDAEFLRNTPVHLVLTCRNMWLSAAADIKKYLDRLGAELRDITTLEDSSPPWVSFITTPAWLIKGKKQFLKFREAGIDQKAYDKFVSDIKDKVNHGTPELPAPMSVRANKIESMVNTVIMEILARKLFGIWARILHGTRTPIFSKVLQMGFRLNLISLIVALLLVLPILRLFFANRFYRIVHNQFSRLAVSFKFGEGAPWYT
ncbi:MAG: hypothetical protein AB7T49_10630 [Oligoflexales bacterium]